MLTLSAEPRAKKHFNMAAAGTQPSETECSICHESFTLPKVLHCGHILCYKCVVGWLKSKPDATCPICRHPILEKKDRDSGKRIEEIIDHFPTDFAMANLIRAESILSKQKSCVVCKGEAAQSICLTCGDTFCKHCSSVHSKQSVSKDHRVAKLANLTTEEVAAEIPSFCHTHNDRVSELHCSDHLVSICTVCAFSDHRHCPEVTKLETKLEEAQTLLDELERMFKNTRKHVRESVPLLNLNLEKIDKLTRDIFTKAEALCDRLESAVKDCRQRLRKMAQDTSCDLKKKIQNEKSTFRGLEAKLTTYEQLVERTKKYSSSGSAFDIGLRIKSHLPDLTVTAAVPSDVKLTLTVDTQAVSRIEQELSQLGQLLIEQDVKLRFHHNHSETVKLSNDCQTAEAVPFSTSWVMSCERMLADMLYQVQVDDIGRGWHTGTALGVLTKSPDTTLCQNSLIWDDPEAVIVTNKDVQHFGNLKMIKRRVLTNFPIGTKLGLAMRGDQSLQLFVDNVCRGVIAKVPSTCYFLFALGFKCRKVTALPVRPV